MAIFSAKNIHKYTFFLSFRLPAFPFFFFKLSRCCFFRKQEKKTCCCCFLEGVNFVVRRCFLTSSSATLRSTCSLISFALIRSFKIVYLFICLFIKSQTKKPEMCHQNAVSLKNMQIFHTANTNLWNDTHATERQIIFCCVCCNLQTNPGIPDTSLSGALFCYCVFFSKVQQYFELFEEKTSNKKVSGNKQIFFKFLPFPLNPSRLSMTYCHIFATFFFLISVPNKNNNKTSSEISLSESLIITVPKKQASVSGKKSLPHKNVFEFLINTLGKATC